MSKGKKMTIKKRIMCLLLAVLWILALGIVSYGDTGAADDIYMEVTPVYGNVGRIGSHVPVTVELYCQSPAPFEGTISFCTLESTEQQQESEVFEYRYPVSAAPGETVTLPFYVLLGQKSGEILVRLEDKSGDMLREEILEFQIPKDTGNLYIGALDDQVEEIGYLNRVSLNYGMLRSELIPLDASTLPSDVRGLDLLDVLIINNFDTSSLSEKQQKAVWQWMESGGILIFGTGERVSDTLGPFTEKLVEVPYEAPKPAVLNMGAQYGENSQEDAVIRAVCAELSIPGGDEVMASDELPILTTVKKGSGKAGIFSLDLGDLSDFAGRNPNYAENFFVTVVGESELQNLYFYGAYGYDMAYWNAQSLVNTGSPDRLPNMALYGIVIFVYILAAGPGLYLFLRKKGLRRYYGVSLVVFSFLASASVYLIGEKTRFRSEFFTYAAIRDVSEEEIYETAYLNARTPDSRPYTVRLKPEYSVTPVTRLARYDDEPLGTMQGKETGNLTMEYEPEETKITVRKSQAFSPKFFKLKKRSENETGQGIGAELLYFDGRISGTVTNHFSFPLKNTALILYGQAVMIGELGPGETKVLDGSEVLTYPADMTYILADKLSGGDVYFDVDISNEEYLMAQERTSLYSFYLSNYYGGFTPEARIAAFGPDEDAFGAFLDDDDSADGMTLYTCTVDLVTEQDGLVYRSGLMKTPKVTTGSGNYYSSYSTMYGSEQVILEYYLGSDIRVEKLSFLPVSEVFLENLKYYYLEQFKGEAYFYNYSTKNYDQVDLEQVDFSYEELKEYLSPSNSLTVKYINGESENGANASLPLLMVTGRER